jgi:hypothetical protein
MGDVTLDSSVPDGTYTNTLAGMQMLLDLMSLLPRRMASRLWSASLRLPFQTIRVPSFSGIMRVYTIRGAGLHSSLSSNFALVDVSLTVPSRDIVGPIVNQAHNGSKHPTMRVTILTPFHSA